MSSGVKERQCALGVADLSSPDEIECSGQGRRDDLDDLVVFGAALDRLEVEGGKEVDDLVAEARRGPDPTELFDTIRVLPRFFLGRLYYRLEMQKEALKVLAGLEDRIRKSPTFHYLLARNRERRGEMHKAVESYRSCVRESRLRTAEYTCRLCRTRFDIWRARCAACGSWNSVELDFDEESVSAEDLGVRKVPMWAVYDEDEK